jgi:hypothetical protein
LGDRVWEALSHEGSNGNAGLTGDLFGAWMRTVSVKVVIVPPRFEGLPTASSQTVPMNGCFVPIVSLPDRGTMATERIGSPRRTARRPSSHSSVTCRGNVQSHIARFKDIEGTFWYFQEVPEERGIEVE